MSGFDAAERLARLRLIRTDGVGPVGFRQLVARFGSGAAAVDAWPDLARRNGVSGEVFTGATADAEMARAEAGGARHLFLGEAGYPALLAELPDAPPVLLALGDVALGGRPCIGMVGARNASAAGRALAQALAAGLGAAGQVVVSGMARGIDAAAHYGALATGTIACVAGGVDVAYPPENAGLQRAVAEGGLLLSELPPGTEPQARHFPRRNRLIAGLSRGLVVVEAALGSGSLITARLAGEAGREVMAVPGHPSDPRARGTNWLLKEGAVLVEDAGDVLACLTPFGKAAEAPAQSWVAPVEAAGDVAGVVTRLLSVVPVAVDEVVRQAGLGVAAVAAVLTDLELEGRLERHAGGRVALKG